MDEGLSSKRVDADRGRLSGPKLSSYSSPSSISNTLRRGGMGAGTQRIFSKRSPQG